MTVLSGAVILVVPIFASVLVITKLCPAPTLAEVVLTAVITRSTSDAVAPGVTLLDAAEAGLLPTALVAVTVKV